MAALAQVLESRSASVPHRPSLDADHPLACYLGAGEVHEWFTAADSGPRHAGVPAFPALTLITQLAASTAALDSPGDTLWIGANCWPYPVGVARRALPLLNSSVFVNPPGRAERIWTIDCALRCDGLRAVIADGAGLTIAESRRLQLAAEAGRTLGLLVRPPWELASLSVARTRWRLTPLPSPDTDQQWTLELLRCKGMRPAHEDAHRWVVRHSHATSDVRLVADVPDRAAPPQAAPKRRAV